LPFPAALCHNCAGTKPPRLAPGQPDMGVFSSKLSAGALVIIGVGAVVGYSVIKFYSNLYGNMLNDLL
jgi:hypothetical protein